MHSALAIVRCGTLIISGIRVDHHGNHRLLRLFPRSGHLDVRHIMSAFYREKVLAVQHWTDTLFSFRATRDAGFRFQNGQFAMIGLEVEGRPLLRAYSMASA